jgi:hypothetical protein
LQRYKVHPAKWLHKYEDVLSVFCSIADA